MELIIHPKEDKITIEIPKEWVNKDLVIKPKNDLDELFGIFSHIKPNYELEEKAWEIAVKEKYGKKDD